jgi:hypothetical protein
MWLDYNVRMISTGVWVPHYISCSCRLANCVVDNNFSWWTSYSKLEILLNIVWKLYIDISALSSNKVVASCEHTFVVVESGINRDEVLVLWKKTILNTLCD